MTNRPRQPKQRAAPDQPSATQRDGGPPLAREQAVAGIVGEAVATRSGEDTRRRGWFWHWNSIVTQFAPLIGLKGVGLLNSYTVWTDRREESPHRGYAFPSQQREADFYGEDRAELITINKILVALDLIEIKKEMVLRVDEQGRRWRVPHNFYRVKDHGDGFTLTPQDVMRVVELAARDDAVYRYIRRIFSTRFAPIDADNVWVRILEEVRHTETWQRLAARAAREEDRASARTRAGHAARKTGLRMPINRDTGTTGKQDNDSAPVTSGDAGQTDVATINNGFTTTVAPGNTGLSGAGSTGVDGGNTAPGSDVGPSNTTYYQSDLTTTTEEGQSDQAAPPQPPVSPVAEGKGEVRAPTSGASVTPALTTVHGGQGPGGQPAPVDVVGEEIAIRAFEDANARRSTPAERHLLRSLAERFDPAARRQAQPGYETGWAWVAAAIYEAVEAGSAFVAPRRLREILARWEREGIGGNAAARVEGGDGPRRVSPGQVSHPHTQPEIVLGDGPDLPLPHGFGSRRTWEFTVGLLAATLGREALAALVSGTAIIGYRDGEITLGVPTVEQAERIAGEYRELIARKLGEAMRRPIRLAVQTVEPVRVRKSAGTSTAGAAPGRVRRESDDPDDDLRPVPFIVSECGLPSNQVWAAVLEEAALRGEVGRTTIDAWLRTTTLLGRGEGRSLIVGVPHPVAQQRITSRFLPALVNAVAAVTGERLPVEIVVERDWLRAQGAVARRSEVAVAGVQDKKRA